MIRVKTTAIVLGLLTMAAATGQVRDSGAVASKPVSRTVDLPGEFQPYQSVSIHARVSGYVEKVAVDRGSTVKRGDVLVELSAPEMAARIAEAESKILETESERAQAEAQAAGAQSTYERLRKAAQTPGAVAENEIVQVEQQVKSLQALAEARRRAGATAEQNLKALREMQEYLKVTAPFDGTITERLVHPGALAGPETAMLQLEQVSRLRLIVALPEQYAGELVNGARVAFRVPAYPERTFSGTVARSAHALDSATRTMPVEVDVANADGKLLPGMYPTVQWPVKSHR